MAKVILFLLVIFPVLALGQPVIESVVVETDGSGTVHINGVGFGYEGPNVEFFADFSDGEVGEEIWRDATIGSFLEVHPGARYGSGNGDLGALFVSQGYTNRGVVEFEGATEIFVSYNVEIPEGNFMPGAIEGHSFPYGGGDAGEFGTFKMARLWNGPGEGDLYFPACYPSGMALQSWSSDNSAHIPGQGETYSFSFQGKNRMSMYLNVGDQPRTDPALVEFEMLNSEFGSVQYDNDTDWIFFPAPQDGQEDPGTPHWTLVSFPGNQQGGSDGEEEAALYDDIYIATGPGARARVEVGDAPEYGNCLRREIMIPTSWDDDVITATIPAGKFEQDEQVYFFVTNAQGEVTEVGVIGAPVMGMGPPIIGEFRQLDD